MAVTITTNTLSSRVRYLNVSGSSVNADAKDIVLAMANALINLGWSRHDTAGETSVVGTSDNAGVVLRRAMHDNAQSGHFNYIGLRLVGTSNNTYTFHLIQAADWSSTTSMSSFVNAAGCVTYTPNTTGNTRFLDFIQGGTIWMFDSGRTLLLTSQSGSVLTKDIESTWLVSEYKKEFGENVNAATGYIHNGVFTNDRWFFDGCGYQADAGYGGAGDPQASFCFSAISAHGSVTGMTVGLWNSSRTRVLSNFPLGGGRQITTGNGAGYSQFTLTEAPSTGLAPQNSVTITRIVAAPAAVGNGFSTRLLMGYLGYIGHLTATHQTSIYAEFLATEPVAPNIFKHPTANTSSAGLGTSQFFQTNTQSRLFAFRGSSDFSLLNNIQEFSPATLTTNLKFTVFEPTLSCGTSNGIQSIDANSPRVAGNTYSGPQYKFSMLGRMFDVKIFGPFPSEKYTFLDSITIPCNTDGFYDENGVDKQFWIVPCGNNMAFVMPK